MKYIFGLATVIFAFSMYGESAFCWGDLGHGIVGAVAEENIKPTTKAFLHDMIGLEPLAVAAVFPDHARDDYRFGNKKVTDYNFDSYHFCEIPYGQTYFTRVVKPERDCFGAIAGARKILEDETQQYSREEKVIAVRYLVHVMGDIHQPLHVGNGHDRGGNACMIHWFEDPAGKNKNFHSSWDDNMVQFLGTTYGDPKTKKNSAVYQGQFLSNFKARRPEMFTEAAKLKYGQGTVDKWLEEAAAIRDSGIYPDKADDLKGIPKGEEYKSRPYCQWYSDQEKGVIASGSEIDFKKIPTLTEEYAREFAPVVETQILKAGVRLAAILDGIADDMMKSKGYTDTQKTQAVEKALGEQDGALKQIQKAFVNPKTQN